MEETAEGMGKIAGARSECRSNATLTQGFEQGPRTLPSRVDTIPISMRAVGEE